MSLHYEDAGLRLWHGKNMDVLPTFPDGTFDSIVTDPPYELGFMGKGWDSSGIAYNVDMWRECLRVLKPGGFLLAFGGTRTAHRVAVAIEDAGFEVRDSIAWLYGSGFAKSWNFATQYDGEWCQCQGGKPVVYSHASDSEVRGLRDRVQPTPVARGESEDAHLFSPMQWEAPRGGVEDTRAQGQGRVDGGVGSGAAGADAGRLESRLEGRDVHRAGQGISDGAPTGSPEGASERVRGGTPSRDGGTDRSTDHAAGGSASPEPRQDGQPTGEPSAVPGSHVALDDGALRGRPVCPRCGGLREEYRGFGTALKPAFEPVICARKPLIGTVAANVLAYGTGALNIDATRTESDEELRRLQSKTAMFSQEARPWKDRIDSDNPKMLGSAGGRWPTNVVLDGAAADALDAQTGTLTSGTWNGKRNGQKTTGILGEFESRDETPRVGDSGGASRFFPTFRYEAKAPSTERPEVDGTQHATVKPLELMRWLVRLTTRPGGRVLDPFAGSGTTGEAALLEGMEVDLIELEADHLPLILQRVRKPLQPSMFGDWDEATA